MPAAPLAGVVRRRSGTSGPMQAVEPASAPGTPPTRPPSDPAVAAAGPSSDPAVAAAGPSSDPEVASASGTAVHPHLAQVGRDLGALVKLLRRGSASPGERLAAEHLGRELTKAGLDVTTEDFRAPSSDAWEHITISVLLASAGVLVALYPLAGLICGLLCAAAFAAYLLELPTPLDRVLPRESSRNVVGVVPASRGRRRKLVIVANYDAAQALFRGRVPGGFFADRVVTLLAAVGAAGLSAWRLTSTEELLADGIGLGIAVYGLVRLLFMLHGLGSKVVPGANDNASGVAAALQLARRFTAEPPAEHEIAVLLTGSKESGCRGMRHHLGLEPTATEARYVVLEGVGAGRLHLITSEGMIRPIRYPNPLPDVGRRLLSYRQHRSMREARFARGFLEARAAARAHRSVVAVVGLDGLGRVARRYRLSDTPDKVDPAVVCRAADFVWDLVRDLETRPD